MGIENGRVRGLPHGGSGATEVGQRPLSEPPTRGELLYLSETALARIIA